MRTVEQDTRERGLPPSVQEALGELVCAAKDGLLALSVGVGRGVLSEMMEAELDEVVGPKGKRNPDRAAVRHGHESAYCRTRGDAVLARAYMSETYTARTARLGRLDASTSRPPTAYVRTCSQRLVPVVASWRAAS